MKLTLSQKMAMYRDGMATLEKLEEEILEQAIETGERPDLDGVAIKDSKGRSTIHWEDIALELHAEQDVIDEYTVHRSPQVKWKQVVTHIGVPNEIKLRWTTPGTPSTRLVLT